MSLLPANMDTEKQFVMHIFLRDPEGNSPPEAKGPPFVSSSIVSCDHYIAELRLLLAERMHQALESAIGKAQGDCGILEESIEVDYQGRFGKALDFVEAGFPTLKDMIRSTCLDIVQMQQLKAGDVVKIGFTPTAAFKLEAGKVLASVRDVYAKLVLENRMGSQSASQGDGVFQSDQKSNVQKPVLSTAQVNPCTERRTNVKYMLHCRELLLPLKSFSSSQILSPIYNC